MRAQDHRKLAGNEPKAIARIEDQLKLLSLIPEIGDLSQGDVEVFGSYFRLN